MKTNILFNKATNNQHHLIGLSIIRVTIGLHLLWQLLLSYPIKEDLWQSYFLNPNVEFLHNPTFFTIFYFFGIIIMLLYTLGLGTIYFNFIVYIFVFILYKASPFLGDGGSNILIIVLVYMIFTNNSAYFSLFPKKPSYSMFGRITHNLFLSLVLIQTCILYFFAGFFKIQGDMWLHGTALYYVLNLDAFNMNLTSFLSEVVTGSPMLLTIGAYSAMFLQFLFPFLVFNKYTRYVVLVGSIGFHLGIAILMGLVQFGMIMLALDLAFLNDREYKLAYNFVKNKVIAMTPRSLNEQKGIH
ncbi:HTTM domain-containing protein [Lentibacillus sediminis]|uniref:HTTM domain-containing protein n=1 Tax=Lentibacillus sediminis TaxID=1940529 RepID=UPI000C1BE5BC|nr:HTTM domain-containing protein [Lentibacillus sediminis]